MRRPTRTATTLLLLTLLGCTARAGEADKNKGKDYSLSAATDPAAVTTSAPAAFQITISPKGSWVLKPETPLRITLDASEGLELAKPVLTAKDMVDVKARDKTVRTGMSAKKPGAHRIGARMSFFLCKNDICQRFKDELEQKLNVE